MQLAYKIINNNKKIDHSLYGHRYTPATKKHAGTVRNKLKMKAISKEFFIFYGSLKTSKRTKMGNIHVGYDWYEETGMMQ